MAATVMIVLAINAREAWNRLAAVERIAVVADVSADMFTALHNLRVDRATTSRDLNADVQFATLPQQLIEVRGGDMPALKSAVVALAKADFPDKQSALTSLSQAVSKLEALHQQTAAALAAPKSARPPGLAKEYFTVTTSLMDLLDNISAQLNRSVKLEDSYIDQLMELKQLAWIARNGGGDASVVISNTLGGLPLPPDALTKYMMNVSTVDTAWAALEDLASGLPVPERFTKAVAEAKREFFGDEYTQLKLKTLKQLIAGEKVATPADTWSKMSVSKLASLLNVAVAALDTAKEYTAKQHEIVLFRLLLDLGLLAAAIALVAGMMVMVSRRVTGPLRNIQQAMLKVAGGDFSVVLPGLERKDEIGDVANAVERFKVLADEKARAEAAEAVKRQQVEADRVDANLRRPKPPRRPKSRKNGPRSPKSRPRPSRRSASGWSGCRRAISRSA